MKLQTIHDLLSVYKSYLQSPEWKGRYKWQAVELFQSNWDMSKADFRSMFDSAISDDFCIQFWLNRPRRTKDVILRFGEIQPEQTKQMFHDLLYDRVSIESRVEHFQMDCSKMLTQVLHHVGNTFSRHFHEDYDAISIYLTLKYPNKYIFFNHEALVHFLKKVEARQLPDKMDIEKYNQLIRTIGIVISRDEEISEFLNKKLDSNCYQGESHLLAHDLIEFIFSTA